MRLPWAASLRNSSSVGEYTLEGCGLFGLRLGNGRAGNQHGLAVLAGRRLDGFESKVSLRQPGGPKLGPAHAPDPERGVEGDRQRIRYDAQPDSQWHQPPFAAIDHRHAHPAGQRGLGKQTEQVERYAGFLDALNVPIAVDLLAQRTHQPGGLEIARRHQHAAGADDNGRQWPERQAEAEREVNGDAPPPAQLL